ncbi:echinoderm microtubule-associated protein-like 1 [Rhopilema esculentum]|uniref:echinoderm microtubule-associated protein-like 1 n=1 Tax=Rhopilema esculentum TaxID=499914 RepID=UPI0031E42AB5
MGSIQALCVLSHDLLLTYGVDDKLLTLWETRDGSKQPAAKIKITGDHGDVTSIAVSPNHHDHSVGNTDIFVGTTKNRILQGTLKTQFRPIMKGHNKETTSLAANPCDNCIVTVGLDMSVTYRSVEDNSIIWDREIEFPATSVAFYPYGNVVAVGMDSGRWCVLKSEDGQHVASFQCGKNALSCMAYSAEGGDIAIGTSTGDIYLFAVYDEGHSYRLVASVKCQANKIVAIDWERNGSHLRILSEDWDQVILNTEKLTETQDLQMIADMDWQSQSSTLSYSTAGIWKPGSDLKFLSAATSVSGEILCAGTEYGQLRIFNFPCSDTKMKYREYSTHVGSITKVCFLPSKLHLVSVGRYDNAVMQWRITLRNTDDIGIKSSYYRERTMEDQIEGKSSREKSSSFGHRRIRGSESRLSGPFSRTGLHRAKGSSVENIPNDYNNVLKRMDTDQMQDFLHRSGVGLSETELAVNKSIDYLEDYAVISPITKEQKQKRQRKGSLPHITK